MARLMCFLTSSVTRFSGVPPSPGRNSTLLIILLVFPVATKIWTLSVGDFISLSSSSFFTKIFLQILFKISSSSMLTNHYVVRCKLCKEVLFTSRLRHGQVMGKKVQTISFFPENHPDHPDLPNHPGSKPGQY